ncbi:DMT family transporter [Pannonibacter tanglangensis]|uniref:DMT family transporter n=1 Tax=Pannonibacter tanglangensis TaxID=2750084 RepID=UPI0032984101
MKSPNSIQFGFGPGHKQWTPRVQKPILATIAPGLFVLLWSTGFIGSKLGAPYADPFVFLSVRYLAVLPFLLVFAVAAGSKWPNNTPAILHCIVTGMLVHGIYLGGVFWAIDRGMPAGASALMVGLQPVLTALAAGWLLGDRIGPRHWAGMALGSLGLVLIVGPKLGLDGSGITIATITAMAAAVLAMSFGTVYQKRFVPATDHVTATVWQYVGALIVSLPMTLGESWQIDWSPQFVFALAWLVLVLSIGAILLLMYLIRAGAVAEVASLFYLVPVATTIESYFLFGERLAPVQIAGMGLVVAAILLIRRKRTPPPPADAV